MTAGATTTSPQAVQRGYGSTGIIDLWYQRPADCFGDLRWASSFFTSSKSSEAACALVEPRVSRLKTSGQDASVKPSLVRCLFDVDPSRKSHPHPQRQPGHGPGLHFLSLTFHQFSICSCWWRWRWAFDFSSTAVVNRWRLHSFHADDYDWYQFPWTVDVRFTVYVVVNMWFLMNVDWLVSHTHTPDTLVLFSLLPGDISESSSSVCCVCVCVSDAASVWFHSHPTTIRSVFGRRYHSDPFTAPHHRK